MINQKQNILLNPGPVNMSDRVKKQMISEDFCHREKEFSDLIQDLNSQLATTYEDMMDYESVILTSSGTGAVEGMLTSFIHDEKSLIVSNGVYGERMEKILRAQNKAYHAIKFDWLDPIDVQSIADSIDADRSIKNLILVHHETTTGRLNKLQAIGQLCKKYDLSLYLDGVSSFGAEEIMADEINLKAVAASANKCLHGAPGLAFVIAHKDQWKRIPKEPSGVYFDLHGYYHMQKTDGFSPFTQGTHLVNALHEAMLEFKEMGGWKARNALFQSRAEQIYLCLHQLGIKTLIPKEDYSSVLRSYRLPEDIAYQDLHAFMKNNGFVIYQGQGSFKENIFRISTMGHIEESHITLLCDLFEDFFNNHG